MYNTKNRYEQGQALRKEIYMYIVSYIKLVGYAPSITEISERVDAGRATVWKHTIIWLMMVCSRRTTPVPTGHILQLGTE